MPVGQLQRVFETACKAAHAYAVEDLADGKLLHQYLLHKDGPAFAELVRRHGPMVLGVCRRVIGCHHDSEDAFQATFLVLARKAGSLSASEPLAGWLHGVAYRTALEARGRLTRRQAREAPLSEFPDRSDDASMQNEIKAIIDREVSRLPDKYRLPVVLCELEGRSRGDAARQLRVAEGTLSSRLAAARKALAKRLSKYGFSLPATGLLVFVEQNSVASVVPDRLVDAVVSSAVQSAMGRGSVAVIPETVRSLADTVIRGMSFAKAKLAIAYMAVVGMLVTGVAIGASREMAAVNGVVPQTEVKIVEGPKQTEQREAELPKVDPKNNPLAKTEPETPKVGKQRDESPELKVRLKQMETEIVRIRRAMVKECEEEERRLDDVIRDATHEMQEALRNRDLEGNRRALQVIGKAGADKVQVSKVRSEIETRIRIEDVKTPREQQLGLWMMSPSNVMAKVFAGGKDRGLVVERVGKDSAAAIAGLQPFDVLLEVNGKVVPHNVGEFRKLLTEIEPHSTVDVLVQRKGKRETIKGFVITGIID